MNKKEIYQRLKDIYQKAVDDKIAEGKPYNRVKDNYRAAFDAFQAKERGMDIFFQPLESVMNEVAILFAEAYPVVYPTEPIPQPIPEPVDPTIAEDAERYRWIAAKYAEGKAPTLIASTKQELDALIDAEKVKDKEDKSK